VRGSFTHAVFSSQFTIPATGWETSELLVQRGKPLDVFLSANKREAPIEGRGARLSKKSDSTLGGGEIVHQLTE
jgi:hypothetical protein